MPKRNTFAYIGGDLTDVGHYAAVGLSFATANARTDVKRAANAGPMRPAARVRFGK
jgi:3-deoxy-D-manno-octulosonate 8-phosphate phosphatase KdsC-like HAD superfamily phosphatase